MGTIQKCDTTKNSLTGTIPTPPISVTSSYLGGIESQRKVQYNNVLKKRLEEEKKEIVNVMISFRDEKKCARERQQVERGGKEVVVIIYLASAAWSTPVSAC